MLAQRHRSLLIACFAAIATFTCSATHAQTSEIAASVTDTQGRPVIDAVVVALPADGKVTLPPKPREEIIDQVDKEFTPKVKAVVVGTPVMFPNADSVRHQVYSFSPAKRFEVPLYAGKPAQPIVFDKPGVVVLGCNIHDWMVGYVYVSESPYFGKTDRHGKVVLAVPAGQHYAVRVWQAQMESTEEATRRNVDLGATRRADISWTLELRPEVKVRRAPVGGHAGHY